MREKALFHCRLCGRTVSLWRGKDGRLLCPRCAREVNTNNNIIVAVRGKGAVSYG